MLRQTAFEGSAPCLKGMLHCHSTRSDGRKTPEEVVQTYASLGFSFLALTDHNIYNRRSYAPETGLIVLPGMEISAHIEGDVPVHVYHTVAIGRADADCAQDERFPEFDVSGESDFIPAVTELHHRGCLTLYCHPEWSATPAREFENIPDNFAMEIWNSSCAVDNGMDMNAACWDELLAQGRRIFGAATDDSHIEPHYGGGWVVVRAQKNAESILAALESGAFYSTCGPALTDFFVENGQATVKAPACAALRLVFDRHPAAMRREPGVTSLTAAVPRHAKYVRAEAIDEQGRRAWSNPIFLK